MGGSGSPGGNGRKRSSGRNQRQRREGPNGAGRRTGSNGTNGSHGAHASRARGTPPPGRRPGNGPWQVRIGVNPIVWSNDDFRDLGGDISLERCLAEMKQVGYAGSELGHKFPRSADTLSVLLDRYDLQLVSGWHSLHLLERDFEVERRDYENHLELLRRLGSDVVIVAECSRRTYSDPLQPLQFDERHRILSEDDWSRLADGLDRLSSWTRERGMQVAYHHHMGTVIQSREEIDELMRRTRDVGLLIDTGHLTYADADPLAVLRDHVERVVHVHLKDVRPHVLMRARAERQSFSTAVRAGVFTVPGDGSIDFAPFFTVLRDAGYRGWLVVEAEQDPQRSHPLHYARMGLHYIEDLTTTLATGVDE